MVDDLEPGGDKKEEPGKRARAVGVAKMAAIGQAFIDAVDDDLGIETTSSRDPLQIY